MNEALSDEPSDTLDQSMKQETDRILRVGFRIAQCIARAQALSRSFAGAANGYLLAKIFRKKLWDNSKRQCLQVPGIGRLLCDKLASGGVTTLA